MIIIPDVFPVACILFVILTFSACKEIVPPTPSLHFPSLPMLASRMFDVIVCASIVIIPPSPFLPLLLSHVSVSPLPPITSMIPKLLRVVALKVMLPPFPPSNDCHIVWPSLLFAVILLLLSI